MNIYNNLDSKCVKIDQPESLKIELMDHQRTAVNAMLNLEKNGIINVNGLIYFTNQAGDYKIETTIGILGDKVGSGKSLMVITLFLLSKTPNDRDIFYESSRFINIKSSHSRAKYLNSNLLIIPNKIMDQWINFFNELAPTLKKYVCDSDESINKMPCENELLSSYDVIIVPCNKSEKINSKFGIEYRWDRIIIDEADSIKLSKQLSLNASFVWLITGTPSGIYYANKSYLSQIFQKNKSWITEYITVKNNKEYIDESISLPIAKRIYIKCLTPIELKIIKDIIPKNIIAIFYFAITN